MNRGLTREQAEAGVIPDKLTKEEWHLMHKASLDAELDAMNRTNHAYIHMQLGPFTYSTKEASGEP